MLNFHFRGPKKQRVPKWMRKYIIGYLGKVFCFCHESNLFYPIIEDNNKYIQDKTNSVNISKKINKTNINNLNSNINKTSNDNNSSISNYSKFKTVSKSNLNNEYLDYNITNTNQTNNNNNGFNFKNIITENNSKENRLIMEFPNNQDRFQSKQKAEYDLDCIIGISAENNQKNIPKTSEKANKLSSGNEISPFNERISRNLEKMLIKLQKSFDPFKLQDENLKFEMLKEILECQRLLLQANLNGKKRKQITINEIYDEWKILAMIVDRICFFIYLFALIGSSVLFFFKENLIND